MPEPEDQNALVLRCQLGDRAAWEELVRIWHPRLWRFVYQMLGDPVVAEDVVQNAWVRVVT